VLGGGNIGRELRQRQGNVTVLVSDAGGSERVLGTWGGTTCNLVRGSPLIYVLALGVDGSI
jgi:hypothetical protein